MVKSVDVAAAKKIKGVVDVVTWEDEDLKNFGRRGGMGSGAPKPEAGAPKSKTEGSASVAFGPPAADPGLGAQAGTAAPKPAPKAKPAGDEGAE
jgi:hypothetical protein